MADPLEESTDHEGNVVIGPLKLCIGQEKVLVQLTCTRKQASAACRICVHKCSTVPSLAARPFCLVPPHEIKKGPLIFDYTITPATAINLDRFECNHGKPKLAVCFYQSKDNVGGPLHKEMVFKEHCRSSTGKHVATLDALLCQGPYKDMHPFDVDIAPHQCIPEGPARLVIFPTHISVVKRYKQKKQKDVNRRGGQIATIKREMRQLPMVVKLKDLDNFSPLQLGFRFEVSGQSYFFSCNEGGEEMNSLVWSYRNSNNRRSSIIPIPDEGMTRLPRSAPPERKVPSRDHRCLRRLMSEPQSALRRKPGLTRQLSAPENLFLPEGQVGFIHHEDVTPPLVERPHFPERPLPCPPLPPKPGASCEASSPSFPAEVNHYENEWAARRCKEELQGGVKLNIGILSGKPQLGRPWLVYVVIYQQGVPLKEVKEHFPSKVDIVCPPRAFQVAHHLSINAELPEGWTTKDVVKEIRLESLKELTDCYIHEICILHNDTAEKQFHGRIHVRQGLVDTLTLNIITNFSLYERAGKRREDEPLYDLVPATRGASGNGRGKPGMLQQFSKRKQFCDAMDILDMFGNDYRLLGEKIGLDYQALLAIDTRCSRPASGNLSPTELVLREWERGWSTEPFSQEALVRILHDMGRPDIIQDMGLQVPQLKEFGVDKTTANTIQVRWELDTQDITDCTIELKPADGQHCWTTVGRVQNNGSKTFLLENLEPETEYDIRIQPSFQRVTGEWTEIKARTAAVLEEEVNGRDNDVQQDVEEDRPPEPPVRRRKRERGRESNDKKAALKSNVEEAVKGGNEGQQDVDGDGPPEDDGMDEEQDTGERDGGGEIESEAEDSTTL
ncbi:Hypp1025 [Branchiostoma lanceolatum]|uniref:Hypp1025 protein n=1 Tax=Branchiostoma lanceolatum TaxID=7740 RepID=A0A8J9ZF73_BRALA|nr:Hypp1025 [Branchiostoma lanceolatum]